MVILFKSIFCSCNHQTGFASAWILDAVEVKGTTIFLPRQCSSTCQNMLLFWSSTSSTVFGTTKSFTDPTLPTGGMSITDHDREAGSKISQLGTATLDQPTFESVAASHLNQTSFF